MKEFLELYVRNFWTWAGLTIALIFALDTIIVFIKSFFKFLSVLIRGYPEGFSFEKNNKVNADSLKIEKEMKKKNKVENVADVKSYVASADVGIKER